MKKASASLNGLKILNTRPQPQGAEFSRLISACGGHPVDLPALEIIPTTQWFDALPDLANVHQVLFVSANAVTYFFNHLKKHHLSLPNSITSIAIGSGTKKVMQDYGLHSILMPERPDSESLLNLASLQQVVQKTVLYIKGEGGRPLIASTLKKRKADLVILDVYKRVIPQHSPSYVNALWQDDAVDIILFTSEQAIHNLWALFGKKAHSWLIQKPCVVISERLARAAAQKGMQHVTCCRFDEIISFLSSTKGVTRS